MDLVVETTGHVEKAAVVFAKGSELVIEQIMGKLDRKKTEIYVLDPKPKLDILGFVPLFVSMAPNVELTPSILRSVVEPLEMGTKLVSVAG